jgi:hypothetical protein
MKGKLKDKNFSSVAKLINELKILLIMGICQDHCRRPSNCMPSRIYQMLAAKGEAIKY